MKDLYAELFAANAEYQQALALAREAGDAYEAATNEVERTAAKLIVAARALTDNELGRVGYQESDAS